MSVDEYFFLCIIAYSDLAVEKNLTYTGNQFSMKNVQVEILYTDVFVNNEDTHLTNENEVIHGFVLFFFLVVLVNLFVMDKKDTNLL